MFQEPGHHLFHFSHFLERSLSFVSLTHIVHKDQGSLQKIREMKKVVYLTYRVLN